VGAIIEHCGFCRVAVWHKCSGATLCVHGVKLKFGIQRECMEKVTED
jgi:hypothetical protein